MDTLATAAAPPPDPHKSKAPGVQAQGFEGSDDKSEETKQNCSAPSGDGVKRLATARAQAALLGIAVHSTDNDRGQLMLIASMGAWTRPFDGLTALEAWLAQITGRADVHQGG